MTDIQQVLVGKMLFSTPTERVLFGERPEPYIAASGCDTIFINTASPLWSAYTEAGIEISRVMIECICHEELEILIGGEFDDYDVFKAHRIIRRVLRYIDISNGIDVTDDILKRSQETIYNNTIAEMRLAIKRSIQKHRELSGK